MESYKVAGVDIKEVQKQLLPLIIEFDRICRKNGIKYSIEGGTLLGAKKYQGFVPWDDDLDVIMLRSEYEKFISVAKEDLNDKFFLQTFDTDENFPLSYAKLRLNDTKYVQANYEYLDIHHGLFMDIVPFDYANKKTYKNKIHKLGVLNGAKNCKLGLNSPIVPKQKIKLIKRIVYKICSLLPLKTINKLIKRTLLKNSDKETKLLYNFTNPVKSVKPFPVEPFKEYTDVSFCGIKLMAIKEYEQFLKTSFGENYINEEPDINKRGPSHAIRECDFNNKPGKKIGILTFHEADNYGAVLQAYALLHKTRQVVENSEYSCEIIDYRNDAVYNRYAIKSIREYKKLKTKIKYSLLRKGQLKNKEYFDLFRKNYLTVSRDKYTRENIFKANDEYSVFITGSDQVWNGLLTNNDKTYFLDFCKEEKRKISYAASVGAEKYWFDNFANDEKNVKRLDFISVRERSLKDGLKERDFDAIQVVDPVFLLNKEQYKYIEGRNKLVKDPYILVYVIAFEKDVYDFAKALSKKTNKKIVYINPDKFKKPGMVNLRNVPVQHFISLIKNADCVITSSFHGLAFSAIYNKDVYYSLSKSENNFNSRMETLAGILNIENRNILNKANISYDPIDWSKANQNIAKLRESSIEFLKTSIFKD